MSSVSTMSAPDPKYKWLVLVIVMIGILMSALDTSIVNVSIPAMMADFGSNINDIQWVVTAYMLAFAVLMPLTSWLRDKFGHKILYIISLIVFTGGSILCGMAWNLPSLIVARIIQALGGGAMGPIAMAMVTEVFEPQERGKAMGLFGLGVIIGPAFGPTLGGYLTEIFGWRSIFLINLPIGIMGVILAAEKLLHDKPHHQDKKPFDLWGFIFLSTFLISFLLGISRGEQEGWTSRYIIICTILSTISFFSFLLTETLVPNRIVDLGLFKYPVFATTMLIVTVRSVALFGGIFLLPLFLQQLKGLTAVQSGLILLPGSLILALLMPIAGRISDQASPRFLSILGLFGLALFMYMYRNISIYMSSWDIILPTLVRGVGMSLLMAPVMSTAMNSIPRRSAGMASSMMNIIQQIGGAVGIAMLSTVLNNRLRFHLANVGTLMQANSPAYLRAMSDLQQNIHNLGLTHQQAGRLAGSELFRYVYVAQSTYAFQDAFLFGVIIVAIAILPTFLLPKSSLGHTPSDAGVAVE